MTQPQVTIGLLLSSEGTYQCLGQSSLAGARHAIADLNRQRRYGFELRALEYDPRGELERYREGAVHLLRRGVRHIFGTTTSASRKDVIPDLQQHDALLWYACSYEGFESSENVVYLCACPNQALLPLLRYAIGEFGKSAFLIGSNYVWGWESNRITRDALQMADGNVLGERYVHLGSTAGIAELFPRLVGHPPSFILNNLVGESSYFFLRGLDAACARAGLRLPVLSYDLTEAELEKVGPMKALRLFTAGPYFEPSEPAFTLQQRTLHGPDRLSHLYTCAYVSIELFADARQACGSDDPAAMLEYLHQMPVDTAIGKIRLCSRNNHSALPCHIAELDGEHFRIVHSEAQPIDADPYLTTTSLQTFREFSTDAALRRLRIVK
ncbi:MAG TPA: transporter substrate-binding protein [Paraburkholderia sp.]|nr:transporter substrate-binding protein [Paraburkholderia sp.]